jgi:hypothetical protein
VTPVIPRSEATRDPATRRGFLSWAAAVALVAAVPLVTTDVLAATARPRAEVMVLHATNVDGGGSIDPRIGNMPQLRRPPLSAYNTYKLLDKTTLPLEKDRPSAYKIANGRTLQVTLLEVTDDKRYRVRAEINQPQGEAFLKLLEVTASPNEPLFVGGQAYQGGTLVLAMTMRQ